MPLVLHKIDGSPPARAVLMVLDILGLDAQMIEVKPVENPRILEPVTPNSVRTVKILDTRNPEFMAKNPLHTIPLLEEGDFILADSHAIITYLVSKYGADKRQSLYPSDYNIRAIIDQRMYLDASILFPLVRAIVVTVLADGEKGPTAQQIADVEEGYGYLEKYLEKQPFLAHDKITLADISLISTISSLDVCVPISDKFPLLTDWFGRLKENEFYKRANEPGLNQFRYIIQKGGEVNSS